MSAWYLHLGKKDPESKRIQAEILALFTAQTYLMISAHSVQTGAKARFDLEERFGPVEFKLVALIGYDAGIFWKPVHVEGALQLEGGVSLEVFGIGFGLVLRVLLAASAPRPYRVYGRADVELSLPWPLPDVEFTVELSWSDEQPPDRISPFLKGAIINHHKLPGAEWEVMEWRAGVPEPRKNNPDVPIIPIDARPVLSFARPLSGRSGSSGEDGRFQLFPPDQIDNWAFEYDCASVELAEWENGIFKKVKEHPLHHDTEYTTFDFGPESLRPTVEAQEPQWQLWGNSPLDTIPPRPLESYTEDNPACRPQHKFHCIDWSNIANGTQYPYEFKYHGLALTANLRYGSGLRRQIAPPPRVESGGLRCYGITIHFPEPVGLLELFMGAPNNSDNEPVTFQYFRLGQPATVEEAWNTRRDTVTITAKAGASPSQEPEFDTLQIIPREPPPITAAIARLPRVRLMRLCYKTRRELDLEELTRNGANNATSGTPGAPVLKPDTLYKLTVGTQYSVNGAPSSYPGKTFYFQTGKGPGLNQVSVPRPEENAIVLAQTPLN